MLNKTGKTENSTYLNFFLFPLLCSPVSFLHFAIRYFEQSILVIFSSFHTCSSTPVIRVLLASLKRLLSWTDLQLELALQGFCAVTYAWPLASLRPVVLLILSPFFSELFLLWPLWWWPCLVLLPQWLFSSLLHPSLANVPQSRAECKCYPGFCLLSLFYQHLIWEFFHFHGAKRHLFTNDFQINIFPPKWTFQKKNTDFREGGREAESEKHQHERETKISCLQNTPQPMIKPQRRHVP